MNRRQFMRNSACAAITLAAPAVPGSDKPMIGVRVRSGPPAANISPDFLGLGYEISSVARPGLLSRTNNVYARGQCRNRIHFAKQFLNPYYG
jgi:hypothetical protein